MVKIEPCPFCGIETRLREYTFCDVIECKNENCHVKPSFSMRHYNGDHRNTSLLVEVWNRECRATASKIKKPTSDYRTRKEVSEDEGDLV